MNKRLITVGFLILAICVIGKLLFIGLKNIKIDEFHPAAVIFVVDSSASNQGKLDEQKKYLKQLCSVLDPEDEIKILKVSEDAYLIYEGSAHNSRGINESMSAFTKYDENDYGTAYGDALKKAFSHALTMKKENYIPSIVVIGDLENEGTLEKQINWELLPQNVKNVQQYVPELSMSFLFAHPQKLDKVKEILTPILGETKLIISPEQNVEKATRKILEAIGR